VEMAAALAVVAAVLADEARLRNPTSLLLNMKTSSKNCPSYRLNHLLLALALISHVAASATDASRTFPSPEDAVSALAAAASTQNFDALRVIFGPAASEIENPDRVQGSNDLSAFAAALSRARRIVRESDSRCVLEVGDNHWAFPFPLTKNDGQWSFDTEAGKQELLNRRIGRNELDTLQVMRTCVEAQREYASKDHDGDEVLEFAQRFISTPGTEDGLYWSPDLDANLSPLGPLVGNAQNLGYRHQPQGSQTSPEPFHGYFFKILTSQGKHAPGGKYSYIINGKMIGGFAFVAWPASYGESGIMTFIVNQQGRVYQKDLGPKTAKSAAAMKSYDPDETWTLSPD
jgi:hypothetical protein